MALKLFSDKFSFVELFGLLAARLESAAQALRLALELAPERPAHCRAIQAAFRESRVVLRGIEAELVLTSLHPLEIEDLYRLKSLMAAGLSGAAALGARIGLFGLARPSAAAISAAEDMAEMAGIIREMVPLVNRGEPLEEHQRRLDRLRDEAEKYLLVGMGELYEGAVPDPAELLEMIKWSQIYDRLEETLGHLSEVASLLGTFARATV